MARVAGGSGLWGRKEHAGAWLLADAVRSLLGALVAAPGHPELGPFYLLRGLLKAVRRRDGDSSRYRVVVAPVVEAFRGTGDRDRSLRGIRRFAIGSVAQ